LRGEAFNVLNHANFMTTAAMTALGNLNFGRITSARDPRQIQIAAKLIFDSRRMAELIQTALSHSPLLLGREHEKLGAKPGRVGI